MINFQLPVACFAVLFLVSLNELYRKSQRSNDQQSVGHWGVEGAGASQLLGKAERVWTPQPREKARGNLIGVYKYLPERWKEDRTRLFSVGQDKNGRRQKRRKFYAMCSGKHNHVNPLLSLSNWPHLWSSPQTAGNSFCLWGWLCTGMGFPGRLQSLQPGGYSEVIWAQSRATDCKWLLEQKLLQDGLPYSLNHSVIVCHLLCILGCFGAWFRLSVKMILGEHAASWVLTRRVEYC